MTRARVGSMVEGYAVTYRGHVLTRAWRGHVNVTTADGFGGGFPSFAAARRAVDAQADAPVTVRYVTRPDGTLHVARRDLGVAVDVPAVGPVTVREVTR